MPFPLDDLQTHAVIGAAIRVHRQLGAGFLEAVYSEALKLELAAAQIPFQTEVPLTITFNQQILEKRYRADLVCFGDVLVEIKALSALTSRDTSQVLNYLKASGLERGILLNFGTTRMEIRRLVMTRQSPP